MWIIYLESGWVTMFITWIYKYNCNTVFDMRIIFWVFWWYFGHYILLILTVVVGVCAIINMFRGYTKPCTAPVGYVNCIQIQSKIQFHGVWLRFACGLSGYIGFVLLSYDLKFHSKATTYIHLRKSFFIWMISIEVF